MEKYLLVLLFEDKRKKEKHKLANKDSRL